MGPARSSRASGRHDNALMTSFLICPHKPTIFDSIRITTIRYISGATGATAAVKSVHYVYCHRIRPLCRVLIGPCILRTFVDNSFVPPMRRANLRETGPSVCIAGHFRAIGQIASAIPSKVARRLASAIDKPICNHSNQCELLVARNSDADVGSASALRRTGVSVVRQVFFHFAVVYGHRAFGNRAASSSCGFARSDDGIVFGMSESARQK